MGNTKVVLTDERKQDIYPAATLEVGSLKIDTAFYDIDEGNIVDTSLIHLPSKYANNNVIPNPNTGINISDYSSKMYRLNGATGSKTGLAMSLRVMAGDTVDVFGKMYWRSASIPINNSNPISGALTAFFAAFSSNPAVIAGSHGATSSVLASNTPTIVPLDHWLDSVVPNVSNKPKAYINWILFNDQFVPVRSSSGYESVSSSSDDLKSIMKSVNINQNGYLYIYCSNESNIDVFFDNLQVVHNHGPLLQEDAFYPFGVSMAGICSKAAGGIENKYKFNSSSELNNDLDVGIYETPLRGYDAQIGRFEQGSDPLAAVYNSFSNYAFVGNNPVMFSDPTGASRQQGGSFDTPPSQLAKEEWNERARPDPFDYNSSIGKPLFCERKWGTNSNKSANGGTSGSNVNTSDFLNWVFNNSSNGATYNSEDIVKIAIEYDLSLKGIVATANVKHINDNNCSGSGYIIGLNYSDKDHNEILISNKFYSDEDVNTYLSNFYAKMEGSNSDAAMAGIALTATTAEVPPLAAAVAAITGGIVTYNYLNKTTCQYALLAKSDGVYPVYEWGKSQPVDYKFLHANDVWRYGITCQYIPYTENQWRYSQIQLDAWNVKFSNQFDGNRVSARILEFDKIVSYEFTYGHLPYGNKSHF